MSAAQTAGEGVADRRIAGRLAHGAAWSLAGRAGVALTGLFVSAVLARLLPPAQFGTYLLALSVVSVGALLGGLGLPQVAVRVVAERMGAGDPVTAWSAVRLTVRLSLLGSLVLAAGYLFAGPRLAGDVLNAPDLAAITGLLAGWMVVLALQTAAAEAHRGYADIRRAAIYGGLLASLLLLAVLLAALLIADGLAVRTVVLAGMSCTAIATAIGGAALRGRRPAARPRAARPAAEGHPAALLRIAGPLLVSAVLALAFSFADLWVVAALRTEEEVAVYGAAARGSAVIGLSILVVNGVLAPLVADLSARGRQVEVQTILQRVSTLVTVPIAALTAVLVLLGGPLLATVYGPAYAGGALELAVLALGQLCCVATGSSGLVLAMTGHQRVLAWITAICGALTVLGLVFATRQWGTTGAAVSTAVGYALQNVTMLLAARRAAGVWTHASRAQLAPLRRQFLGLVQQRRDVRP